MEFHVIASDLGFVEGPLWAPDGTLWITSIPRGCLYQLSATGEVLAQVDTGGGPNGLAIDNEGTIYIAQNGGQYGGLPGTEAGIQTLKDGRVEHIVTGFDGPNDLCFGPDGRLYFTDPRGGADPEDPDSALPGQLFVCNRDGSGLEKLLEGPKLINGLAFDASGETLFFIETGAPHLVWRMPVLANGRFGEPVEFFRLVAGYPDGMAIDTEGNIWLGATADCSIQVYGPDGQLRERHPLPEGTLPTNCCFGGEALDELFVAGSGAGTALKAKTSTTGLALRG